MSSITNESIKQITNTEESKSNSTIQLKFSESFVRLLTPTYYSPRKRPASVTSNNTNNHEIETKKKKYHRTFSENVRTRQFALLSQSFDEMQKQNGTVLQRSVSIQNVTENNFEWLKDFMRQSIDAIRDTVVQACITALNSRISTQDFDINNHRYQVPSIIRERNDLLLYQNTVNDEENYFNKKVRVHHRARSSPYPMYRNLIRTPVNDHQVPWSHEWLDYQPIIFTAEEVHINPNADPDLLNVSSSISLRFNTIDGTIDRRSVYQYYQIDVQNGLPLNPIGRTGLQGRGILLRWGPNVYHYIMICRWKRDVHRRILVHPSNGKRILEILLEIQADGCETNDLILTGGLRTLENPFPPQLQDRLKRFLIHTDMMLNHRTNISSSIHSLNQLFQQEPIPWKGAYFDDARNTDNAWIELSIGYILDGDDHRLTSCIPSLHDEQLRRLEKPRFVWKDVQNTIDIGPRTHYRLIRNLAYKLDAHF